MSDDLVKRLRADAYYMQQRFGMPVNTNAATHAADRIEELEARVKAIQSDFKSALDVGTASRDEQIAELHAVIKAYMEAAADAAGGAPDKYAEQQRAFIALRCAINWPRPDSCAAFTK